MIFDHEKVRSISSVMKKTADDHPNKLQIYQSTVSKISGHPDILLDLILQCFSYHKLLNFYGTIVREWNERWMEEKFMLIQQSHGYIFQSFHKISILIILTGIHFLSLFFSFCFNLSHTMWTLSFAIFLIFLCDVYIFFKQLKWRKYCYEYKRPVQ